MPANTSYISNLTTDFTGNVRSHGNFDVDGVLTVETFSANTLAGNLSSNSLRAESGNTVQFFAALSTNTLGAQSGNTLRVVNGASIIARSIDSGGQVFNVRAFGAAGDGTTDDTAAIDACIEHARSTGVGTTGAVIDLGFGHYKASVVLDANNLELRGAGIGATKITVPDSSTDCITIKSPRCKVRGIRVTGTGVAGTGRGIVIDDGVHATTHYQPEIRDVLVESFSSYGIVASGTEQLIMEQVESSGNLGIGIQLNDAAGLGGVDNQLRSVRAINNGGPYQIHLTGGLNGTLMQNTQALYKSGTTTSVLCFVQSTFGTMILGGDYEGGTSSIGIRCSGDNAVIAGAIFSDVTTGIDWSGARGEIRACRFTSSVGGNSVIVGSTATMIISSLADASVNKVSPNPSATLAQMGRSTSGDWYFQKIAPRYALITITGATPSVANGQLFRTNNGASNTTVTNFTSGLPGQRIAILAGDSSTTIIHGTNIFMKDGVNMSLSTGSTVEFVQFASSQWREV